MTSPSAREALSHFLATAAIGLAVTGLSDLLPMLTARQQALPQTTAGYAALSLVTAAGMALYGYVKAHQADLAADLTKVLDHTAGSSAAQEQPK